MLAFQINLNGKKKCLAGVGEPGVLTAHVTWVQAEAAKAHRRENMSLTVGGLVSRSREFFEWGKHKLRRGDESLIRILEVPKPDNPKQRRWDSEKKRLQQQKAYVRKMARQFGWKITAS